MREMTETKKKGFTTLLRITALIAALVTAGSFALPLLRKNSALGAVGGRTLSELTPFQLPWPTIPAVRRRAFQKAERLGRRLPRGRRSCSLR